MKSKLALIILILSILNFSCSSTKTLKFSKKTDEVIKTESLKQFLANTKSPKVVLRVNNSSKTVTEDENIDYLYNVIENQLLASGFILRDRQLFNQIIGNKSNTKDYEILKDKSDTDLIIELTKLDPSVKYSTNKYYNKKNQQKIEPNYTYKRYGASVEFKVILISSNEFAGIYKFNYTPCINGCIISKSTKELIKDLKRKKKEESKAYEGVEKDILEIFINNATKQLVSEMRN